MPRTLTVSIFEPPMRWRVHDSKYKDDGSPFLIDLKDEETGKPKCSCKEFHFNVSVKKFRDRDVCTHIKFLVNYLLESAGRDTIDI